MNSEPFLDFLGPCSPSNKNDLINFDLENFANADFGADFDKIVDDVLSDNTRSTSSPDSGKVSNDVSENTTPCLSPVESSNIEQRKILTPVRKMTENLDLKKGTLHNITPLLSNRVTTTLPTTMSTNIVMDQVKVLQSPIQQVIQTVQTPNVVVLDSMQTISANPGQTLYITNGNGSMQQVQVPHSINTTPNIVRLPAQTQLIQTASPTYQVVTVPTTTKTEPYISQTDTNLAAKRTKYSDDEDVAIEIEPHEKPVMAIEKLKITEEELQLLKQESADISEFYNAVELTSSQEKKLKKVRRKIRNKKSAHESRKRRKEFMDNLQENYQELTEENKRLQAKMKVLENENSALRTQVAKLKAFIQAASAKTAQATTCVMLLVLSLAFFLAPNYGPLSIFKDDKVDKSLSKYDSSNADRVPGFVSRRILTLYDDKGDLLDEPIINEPDFEELNPQNKNKVTKLDKDYEQVLLSDHGKIVNGAGDIAGNGLKLGLRHRFKKGGLELKNGYPEKI